MIIMGVLMENKRECVERLFDTVKCSRSFTNLKRMEYEMKGNGDEAVLLYFKREYGEDIIPVNVTADSCIALIYDVMQVLYKIA